MIADHKREAKDRETILRLKKELVRLNLEILRQDRIIEKLQSTNGTKVETKNEL